MKIFSSSGPQSLNTVNETPKTDKPQLLLIGASGGWMMSTAWLEEFSRIDAYDIDPLAGFLFHLNHGQALKKKGIQLRFHTLDAIHHMEQVLRAHPSAIVWFDNVLGQHRIRLRNAELASAQLKLIHLRLKNRVWGSVHDLYSGPSCLPSPLKAGEEPAPASIVRLDNNPESTARVVFNSNEMSLEQARQRYLQQLGATPIGGAWLDHETSNLFPLKTPVSWVGWAFKPGYYHCLEMGWIIPSLKS